MTARTTDSALLTALSQPTIIIFPLVELYFDSGTQYICGLSHNIVWNGNTYSGIKGYGTVEPIVETGQAVAGLKFRLNGISSADIASVLTENIQGRKAILHLACVSAGSLIVDQKVWSGYLDSRTLIPATDNASVEVTAEHQLIAWSRASNLTSSQADQQAFVDATDKFYEFAPVNSTRIIVWPSKEAQQT